MALIKCPECGKEISDKSKACIHCGYPIADIDIQSEIETSVEDINDEVTKEEGSIYNSNEEQSLTKSTDTKIKYGIIGIVGIVVLLFIIIVISENAKKCSLSSCDNQKIAGSEYCYDHTCKEDGCTSSKSKAAKYCYRHETEYACEKSDCDNKKVDGGDYCYDHTCAESGCYNEKEYGSDYCKTHQIDMRTKLGNEFYFSVNSAGGIELNFQAKNNSGKEIKYIRFYVDLYNAVGDRIEDEIKDTNSVYVEITGPIASGKSANFKEIIGYNDNCAKINIGEVTLEYSDGTSQTGHYGWYTEK